MRGPTEAPFRMEPCLLDQAGTEILDLLAELSGAAHALGARLHVGSAAALADLVRVMNCYYSNLIEGHNMTPRDIERALAGQFDTVEASRNLQLEARAHIRLQRDIDHRFVAGTLPDPASGDFIRWLHRSFYEGAPEAMLWIEGDGRRVRMVPGAYRSTTDHEVMVGRHLPPSPAAVEAFMTHFEHRYRFQGMGTGSRMMAIAAAHHRLNYIHPFLDGNGRVSRLMSHAMVLKAGIGAHGLWSVSRGLARGLESRGEYKRMMNHADMPRQGDMDGRGNLSRRALEEFTAWFLRVCLDQVRFMNTLFDLDNLATRLRHFTDRRNLKPAAFDLLDHVLRRGEMPRGDAARATGLRERAARDTLGMLVAIGVLGSDTPKGPVSLRFPLHTAEVLFPALFPQA